jgi:hypothetical protein
MAPGAASRGFSMRGDRIQGEAVDAARARHHPVEDDDDLPLRRIRQRPVTAEPARPALDLLLGDVLEPAWTERRPQVVADHRVRIAHRRRLALAVLG